MKLDFENLDIGRGGRTEITSDELDPVLMTEVMKMITDENGLVKPVPYDSVKDVGKGNLNIIMQTMGLYTFPTAEVVEFLRGEIDDGDPDYAPDAIEICAGTGWIGRNLDIPITDSHLQEREDIMKAYISNNCMPIKYPKDVEKMDAITAIKHYEPEFVIGSYVTRKWGIGSKKVGSIYGVDTSWVVNNCHKFFLIGNENVHGGDPIMKRKHETYAPEWLITRGNTEKARIWVWENKLWNN